MTWCIAAVTLALVVLRPWRINEAIWAVAGAALLVALDAIAPSSAAGALVGGADVYAFLAGMMLLAEFAKFHGVFDWLAARAVDFADASRSRLFALVYAVGILTTALFSNDATIVVLTPAVLAALKRIDATPAPYLYACAFIANAASFVLPISNPSNLLVFAGHMPPLATWLRWTALPSIVAIAVTFVALRFLFRRDVRGSGAPREDGLAPQPRPFAIVTLVLAALTLVIVSALGGPLGYTTLAVAGIALLVALIADRATPRVMVRETSWSVIVLTAALFVIVAAIDRAGALAATRTMFEQLTPIGIGLVTALASNIFNNLPVGLNVGAAITALHPATAAAYAALVGVNLGPNLSTNGSLATILWLAILRRNGVAISPLAFLRVGAIVTPLALIAALAVVR